MARVAPDLLDPARYIFTYEMQTRLSDMDPNRHLNNVAIIALFEDSRVRFDHQQGARKLLGDLRVMIVAADVNYLAEAQYPAPLALHAAILDVGRSSWSLGQLAMQGGRACAYCHATMVATENGRPVPISDAVRACLEQSRIAPVAGA